MDRPRDAGAPYSRRRSMVGSKGIARTMTTYCERTIDLATKHAKEQEICPAVPLHAWLGGPRAGPKTHAVALCPLGASSPSAINML